MDVAEKVDIPEERIQSIRTLGDAIDYLKEHGKGGQSASPAER